MNKIVNRILIFGCGVAIITTLPSFIFGKQSFNGVLIADIFDLAVAAPFFAIMFYVLYRALTEDQKKPISGRKQILLDLLIIISLLLFFEGHGMHFTANTVHNLITREGLQVSTEASSLLYFFDEILGHKLIYVGFAGLVIAGARLQVANPSEMSAQDAAILHIISPILGFGAAIAVVEGQTALEALILLPIMLVLLLLYVSMDEESARGIKDFAGLRNSVSQTLQDFRLRDTLRTIKSLPFVFFVLASMVWTMIFTLIYASLFGFAQPSEIFGF